MQLNAMPVYRADYQDATAPQQVPIDRRRAGIYAPLATPSTCMVVCMSGDGVTAN